MTLWRCIVREIAHRKLNFALAVAAAVSAVAAAVGLAESLRAFDVETEQLLARHEDDVRQRGKALEDDYRKITKGLGFNILILPKDQPLGDVYADGYARKTMPEEYATRLAQSAVATVEHVLPALEQRVEWPEQKRTVLLAGIRGEIPRLRGEGKKPLLDPVPADGITLGYELHTSLGVGPGDKVQFRGKTFSVAQCYPQRGSKDDITAWINLAEAQAMLDMPGQVNAIWALECNCESIDRLAEIRRDVAGVLPETQVIEIVTQATARAEARKKAHAEAQAALEQAEASRAAQRSRFAALFAVAMVVVVLAAAAWIAILALVNARQRRAEIGILRAIGFRSRQILAIFLGKAVVGGMLGGALGVAAGIAIAAAWRGQASWQSIDWRSAGIALVAAPLLAAVATCVPALRAARLDPARLLAEP